MADGKCMIVAHICRTSDGNLAPLPEVPDYFHLVGYRKLDPDIGYEGVDVTAADACSWMAISTDVIDLN